MRKLVLFTVPFAAATVVSVYFLSLLAGILLAGVSLLTLILVLWRKQKKRVQAAIALLGLCTGFLYCALYTQLFTDPVKDADGWEGEMTATVCDYPEQTDYGCRAVAELTVNGRSAKTLFYLPAECQSLAPGDRITLTGRLRRSDVDRGGDTYLYYESRGVHLIGTARSDVTVSRPDTPPLRFLPARFSHAIRQQLAASLPPDAAGLVTALLTGDRSGLRYQEQSDIRMAGLSHVVAISGMHVSILLVFLSLLFRRVRWLTALLGIPIIVFFVFSAGCSPSAVRAAVMLILFLLAPLLGRENDGPTSLCAALLLLLLANPDSIANLSLQLSFGAMAGMLWVTGPVYRWLAARKPVARMLRPRHRLRPRILRLLWALRRQGLQLAIKSLSTTLGALVFTVPIIALTMGTFCVYGLLSNLLGLWAVSVCFVGGLITALLSWIWLPLGQLAGWVVAWPVRYVLLCAGGIARLPFALLTTDSPYLIIWLFASYAGLILAILCKRVALPSCGIAAGLLAAMLLTVLGERPGVFSVTAFDVGQGQSVCMRTPDFTALYDCGGSNGDSAGQHVAERLLQAGVRCIDALVLSHYDLDHIGGVRQLLYRVDVGTIYLSRGADGNTRRAEVETLARQYGISLCYVEQTTALETGTGVLTVYPPVDPENSNNSSLSVLFSAPGYAMLATGDLDEIGERLLLREGVPDVDCFVAGHHGAKTSTSEELLAAIRPETVLISVGDNHYGHPAQQTLDRLTAIGAAVYRTDLCGDITIRR